MSTPFGTKFRELRMEQNISMRAVARYMGWSAAYQCDIENNRRNPPRIDKSRRLADAIGVPWEDMEPFYPVSYEKQLEDLVRELRALVRELAAEIDNATAKIYESVEHEAGQRVMLSGEALTILISALSRIPEELR